MGALVKATVKQTTQVCDLLTDRSIGYSCAKKLADPARESFCAVGLKFVDVAHATVVLMIP